MIKTLLFALLIAAQPIVAKKVPEQALTVHLRNGHAYFYVTSGKYTTVVIDDGYVSHVFYKPGLFKDEKQIYRAYSPTDKPFIEKDFEQVFEFKKDKLVSVDGESIKYDRFSKGNIVQRVSWAKFREGIVSGKIGYAEDMDIWYDNSNRPTKIGKVGLSWNNDNQPYGITGNDPRIIID